MRIESARYENGELILSVPRTDAQTFVYQFKAGEYEIVKAQKARSLDANAYAWLLINKIAEAVKESPLIVYKNSLMDIPGICEPCCVKDSAVEKVCRLWLKDHIGRRVDTEKSKLPGCTNLYLYYGSSDFDTRQMSMLIDNLCQDCRQMGIETRPESEIKALLESWING